MRSPIQILTVAHFNSKTPHIPLAWYTDHLSISTEAKTLAMIVKEN